MVQCSAAIGGREADHVGSRSVAPVERLAGSPMMARDLGQPTTSETSPKQDLLGSG